MKPYWRWIDKTETLAVKNPPPQKTFLGHNNRGPNNPNNPKDLSSTYDKKIIIELLQWLKTFISRRIKLKKTAGLKRQYIFKWIS